MSAQASSQGTTDRAASLRDLKRIPGIGPSLAEDLWELEYRRVEDLKGENPEAMYQRLMDQAGTHIDRCVLYTFRCAVYFASEDDHDPERLKWWNWKDGRI
jgi:hypothetical protein